LKVTDDRSNIDRIIKFSKELNSYTIQIGIFADDDSFIQMIAGVHEFGLTIKPKHAKYLTIPLSPAYVGVPAGTVNGLFFYKAKTGNKFLVRNKGNGGLEFAYMLMDKVKIPERSFIRSTFDEKGKDWAEQFEDLATKAMEKGASARQILDMLGAKMASDIQDKMRDLKEPPKKRSTLAAAPGKSNPLIKTRRLRQSVTWKVVKG